MATTLTEVVAALLGVSTYQPSKGYGFGHDDATVERIRSQLGGNLAQQPVTQLQWYLADLDTAQYNADGGDISNVARLHRAMRRDGTIAGLLGALTAGVVALPKKFYGQYGVDELQAMNGTRSTFDDMCPPSELEQLAADGFVVGAGIGELVDVPGRDFPVFVRQEPEFLRYRWIENRWYFNSVAGPLPITPGDGRWVLHLPGGRIGPWMNGAWPALGRAFINKEHALFHRANYGAKLANPARVAHAPPGTTKAQRAGFLEQLIAWGINTVFELPAGWQVDLLESNGRGWEVFQSEIDTSDKEVAIRIAGNTVVVDGGVGFQNADVFRAMRIDVVKKIADGLAYTCNTQILPAYVAKRYGTDAITKGACVAWPVERPKDLVVQAQALTTVAAALAALREELAMYDRTINIDQVIQQYGLPVVGADGSKAPAFDAPEKESGTVVLARTKSTQGKPVTDEEREEDAAA
jgi:hypothetical protein